MKLIIAFEWWRGCMEVVVVWAPEDKSQEEKSSAYPSSSSSCCCCCTCPQSFDFGIMFPCTSFHVWPQDGVEEETGEEQQSNALKQSLAFSFYLNWKTLSNAMWHRNCQWDLGSNRYDIARIANSIHQHSLIDISTNHSDEYISKSHEIYLMCEAGFDRTMEPSTGGYWTSVVRVHRLSTAPD